MKKNCSTNFSNFSQKVLLVILLFLIDFLKIIIWKTLVFLFIAVS